MFPQQDSFQGFGLQQSPIAIESQSRALTFASNVEKSTTQSVESSSALSSLAKRSADVCISVLGLILLSPMLLVIASIICFESPGPALYRARRIGVRGEEFECLKFRTMRADADQDKHKLAHLNERGAILFKITDDPRVTRLGSKLRKYSLDELPQLWNVLCGEMSLVGPRPSLPDEVSRYEPEHHRRFDVRPGITGLWQVNARQDPSFEKYIALDLAYIAEWSLILDFLILLRTAIVVIQGTGC